jgi:hypothetical protein
VSDKRRCGSFAACLAAFPWSKSRGSEILLPAFLCQATLEGAVMLTEGKQFWFRKEDSSYNRGPRGQEPSPKLRRQSEDVLQAVTADGSIEQRRWKRRQYTGLEDAAPDSVVLAWLLFRPSGRGRMRGGEGALWQLVSLANHRSCANNPRSLAVISCRTPEKTNAALWRGLLFHRRAVIIMPGSAHST